MIEQDDPTSALASWSAWTPLLSALDLAPREPGVYQVREGATGPIVYVGSAGPRSGSDGTKTPQGIRGRLRVYTSGKALTSGLGEALADRAFADADFIRQRLSEVEAGRPMRARDWGKATIERANPHVRWATTPDKASAEQLENACGEILGHSSLWNRRRLGRPR